MIKRLVGRSGCAQRKRIRERDNYTCSKCYRAVAVGEVDHIQSLELGGTNDDSNLQLLCIRCHLDKTSSDRQYIRRDGVDQSGIPLGNVHHWNT